MTQTRVFVSSTCYDLRDLRQSLYRAIEVLGHQPVMSEFISFPVLTAISNVENCTRAVIQSDVFVLVLGGKCGSLDQASGKPIVQVEFEFADKLGLTSLILVRKPLLDLLPIWEKNPTADFSPQVDCATVFKFLKDLKARNQWIYQFENVDQIEEILKARLSELFRHLLSKSREGKMDPLIEFRFESPKSRELANDKPKYWEFLLSADLIETKLHDVNRRLKEIEDGLVIRPIQHVTKGEFIVWLGAKFDDLLNSIRVLVAWAAELQAAWGPLGQPGDPIAIKRETDRLFTVCNHLIDWELEIRFTKVPELYSELVQKLKSSTKGVFQQLNTFPAKLLAPFKDNPNPTGSFSIDLIFESPETLLAFNIEIERLRKEIESRPWDFMQ